MPIDYSKYSTNWKSEIVPAIRQRSGNRCEKCHLRNYSVGYRDTDGTFKPTYGNIVHDLIGEGLSYPSLQGATYKEAKEIADMINENEEDSRKWIVIVLTVAHLNHDISDNHLSNLRHWCQRCHNRYDVDFRKGNRQRNSGVLTLI